MNSIDLKRRTAIVTGGAQGFGLAIAKRFIASGAKVMIWDNDAKLLAKTLKGLRGQALGLAVDVADPKAVAEATRDAMRRLKRIDILVNNAGIAGMTTPLVDYPVDEWERVVRVDLTSQFLCCKYVVPHMQKRKYGRIINVSSVAGKEGNPNAAAYSAAKAGVIALTKSLGKELALTGIRVNCVTPSPARTAILRQVTQQHIDYMLSKIPSNRFVLVEEVAAMVAWLASDECSYTTGATFDLSGGRTTY